MKAFYFLLSSLMAVSAAPQAPIADSLPPPPANLDECGITCINDMYSKARAGSAGIKCSNDPTPSCVCKSSNINFWNGLRDCSKEGCGEETLDKVALWKDTVLCKKGRPSTSTRTATPRPPLTSAPGSSPVPTTASPTISTPAGITPSGITPSGSWFISEGITVWESPSATPRA